MTHGHCLPEIGRSFDMVESTRSSTQSSAKMLVINTTAARKVKSGRPACGHTSLVSTRP